MQPANNTNNTGDTLFPTFTNVPPWFDVALFLGFVIIGWMVLKTFLKTFLNLS